MSANNVDIQSRFVNALRNQGKTEHRSAGAFPCPYGHPGRVFQNIEQLWAHTKADHATRVVNMEATQARMMVRDLALKLRKSDQSLDATAGVSSTPDITGLSLDPDKERPSPSSSRKRRADYEINACRKAPSPVEVADPEFSRDMPHTVVPETIGPRPQEPRLFDHRKGVKRIASPHQSMKVNRTVEMQPYTTTEKQASSNPQISEGVPGRPGLIELSKYDSRYPGLLLQPDSRPISQEQLASEVKSIYAGLTMVEIKCKEVDNNLTEARQNNPKQIIASEHWQALIALHRTLLYEHHDFFLASQHPSASPALRRLAAKYSMPGRMWKIGIHPFLEELRVRLPHSLDHMVAFIYLTYQMIALLYETIPAFEDTWVECLGDLSRYRMAIEDEDIRDREAWANVARSWYSNAADRLPTVGRLPHHLAILARSNALQQIYYYSKSLTSVEPFPSARQSIMSTMNTARGRGTPSYSHAIPIDESFIRAHAGLFERDEEMDHEALRLEFTEQLDNYIGRVTAKWKDHGAHIAITNIAAWFGYGIELNILREVFLTRISQQSSPAHTNVEYFSAPEASQQKYPVPKIKEGDIPSGIHALRSDSIFSKVTRLTHDTFALALRRIGDKNVLPHVHVMLSFFSSLASNENVAHLIDHAPWVELVAFLNTLIKTETQQNKGQDINTILATPVFPTTDENNRGDELPLPEDYTVRGLIWAPIYFPANWFQREHEEEERYLELASTMRSRMERVLRLGFQISSFQRWISYDKDVRTFGIISS